MPLVSFKYLVLHISFSTITSTIWINNLVFMFYDELHQHKEIRFCQQKKLTNLIPKKYKTLLDFFWYSGNSYNLFCHQRSRVWFLWNLGMGILYHRKVCPLQPDVYNVLTLTLKGGNEGEKCVFDKHVAGSASLKTSNSRRFNPRIIAQGSLQCICTHTGSLVIMFYLVKCCLLKSNRGTVIKMNKLRTFTGGKVKR